MTTVYNLSEDDWANKHNISPKFFSVENVKEILVDIPEDI